ncbi:AP-1 complex subunit mu-2 [Camellia lanceoleosa]|uniref:AP-1 complex subunit mu-2 n=1 Tax=Camellia lanceoleosa TaxID=1840588 RepID=A0ACC0HKI7_9ERIC|nr:AP-1 complex subunit mu-2 [Camellia lanceoleosa]
MVDLTSNLRNLATMVDGLVTEGSPSPKGSSHIVKDLLLERDLLTLMDMKRNGGKNQSSASEIVLGMSPRASIRVQSEVPTPSSFVDVMGGLCSEIRDLAQQQSFVLGEKWYLATNVEIELPVPTDATNPNVRTSLGSASYAPEKDALIWKIKSFPGGKEYMLRAEYTLPSITSEDAAPERKAPIRMKFEIPYFAVSGIQKIQILLHLYLQCFILSTKVEWIKPNLVFQLGMINQNQTKLCVPIRWEDSYLMWLNTQI